MASIPDFTDTELWSLRTVTKERYGKDVDVQLADAELRLDPDSTTLTQCPTAFWSERGANFAIFKVGENRYRCQFFYSRREQFGTGARGLRLPRRMCPVLLQVQADHERQQALRGDKDRNP